MPLRPWPHDGRVENAPCDLALPRAIAEHRFAYSRQRNVGMTRPPGAASLDDFPEPMASAFEAAFGPTQQANRPTAAQWVTLLEEYEQSLRQCVTEKLHHYSSAAASCPWCRMENQLGVILFVPSYRSYTGPVPEFDPGSGGFDLARLWAQITAIKIPARSQLTPMLSQVTAQPSAEARAAKFKREGYKVASYAAFVVAGLVLISVPKFWLLSLGLVIVGFVLRSQKVDVASSLLRRFVATETQWDTALEDWERRCGIDQIEALKESLIEAKRSFEGLAGQEREKVSKYQTVRRERQLTSYLERFRIRHVKISGIGQAKEAALASYGIETAADVDPGKVLAVPGFGPVNSRPLIEWRDGLAKKFNYDPNPNASDQAVLGKICGETTREAAQLRQQLTSGAKELRKAAQACEQMRKIADPLLQELEAARSQIKADFAFLGIPLPPRPQPPRRAKAAPSVFVPVAPRSTTTRVRTGHAGATPSCPSCGKSMVRRTVRRGRRRGSQFWGCSQYPGCRGTRPI